MWDLNLHFSHFEVDNIIVSEKLKKKSPLREDFLILPLIVAAVLIKANFSPALSVIYKHLP